MCPRGLGLGSKVCFYVTMSWEKQTANLKVTHLIWVTQTAEASCYPQMNVCTKRGLEYFSGCYEQEERLQQAKPASLFMWADSHFSETHVKTSKSYFFFPSGRLYQLFNKTFKKQIEVLNYINVQV